MGAYGTSIGAGKWYRDTTNHYFTKSEYVWWLNRCLQAVGMVPLKALWPIDLDLAQYNGGAHASSGNPTHYYLYDYPATETFTVGGVAYRPCIAIVNRIATDGSTAPVDNDTAHAAVYLVHCRRRADRIAAADIQNFGRLEVSGDSLGFMDNYYYARPADYQYGNYQGAYFSRRLWSQRIGYVAGTQALLPITVNHGLFVLNQGGLLVQVGGGNVRKRDLNDQFNVVFAFHGGRIPGRDVPLGSDVGIDKIDPVATIPGRSWGSGLDYAYVDNRYPTPRKRSWALGVEHGDKATTRAVKTLVENLDSFDDSIITADAVAKGTQVRNSPRSVGGQNYHILNRAFLYTYDRYSTETQGSPDYYGPVLDNAGIIRPQPKWSEVFYIHGIRWADQYTPSGEFVDPLDSRNYWLFWTGEPTASSVQQGVAFDVEGVNKLSSLPAIPTFPTATITKDAYLDFSVGSTAGPWTGISRFYTSIDAPGYSQWLATAGLDELRMNRQYQYDSDPQLQYDFTNFQLTSPLDSLHVSFEAKALPGIPSTATLSVQVWSEAANNWVTLWQSSIQAFGTAYSAAVASSPGIAPMSNGTVRVRIYLGLYNSGALGNPVIAIRNFHLKRIRRS